MFAALLSNIGEVDVKDMIKFGGGGGGGGGAGGAAGGGRARRRRSRRRKRRRPSKSATCSAATKTMAGKCILADFILVCMCGSNTATVPRLR